MPAPSPSAAQTATSFRDKWENNPDLAWRETLREGSDTHSWITRRNGFASEADFARAIAGARRILDAGCGNGRVTALLRRMTDPATTTIVGIDLVASDVAARNLDGAPNVEVARADLLGDLSPFGRFDLVYCQEVLHHTADPRRAFLNLVRSSLAPDGRIAIYVYGKKAPIREFTDDHVREIIRDMDYEQARVVAAQITAFGRALAEAGVTVRVPDVEALGIKAGEYDVQRLVYHFFMKCFWNPAMSVDENVAINYDWYHPQLATRHTPDEIRGWFHEAGLDVTHEHTDPYGITMWGVLRK